MDNDDKTVGRILTRREALTLIGATGLTALIGCTPDAVDPTTVPAADATVPLNPEAATATSPAAQATVSTEVATAETISIDVANLPNCIVRPESTAGPYYVDVGMMRRDITEGVEGTPLALTFNVVQISDAGCVPLENALVEVWHCDKDGVYSGVRDRSGDTSGQTWLRGAQTTDASGNATFNTIYPGWYPGRCVHIHFRVLPTEESVFTSQLYFPDDFNNQIVLQAPYNRGAPNTSNAQDGIFQESLLAIPAVTDNGIVATFALGIDLSGM